MSRRVLACALLLSFLFLAGCADGDQGTADPTPTASPTDDGTSVNASASVSVSVSSSSSSTTSTAPRAMQTFQKDISDNAFPQGTFTVQKGDKVVWTNRGSNPHSVSTTAGSAEAFDSNANGCPPVCLLAGQTYEHTFNTLGNVTYHCKVHASMTGTITVVAAMAA